MTRKSVVIRVVVFALLFIGLVGLLWYAPTWYVSNSDSNGPEPYIDKTRDLDEDGLSDWHETNIYLTDPENPDNDGDYVSDGLEVNQYGTDPLKIDTDGGGMDDFNEIYTYEMNPNDPNDDKEFMEKIPNVEARCWETFDGGLSLVWLDHFLTISSRDPLIRWYVERAEIIWENTSEGEKEGWLYVDEERIITYGDSNTSTLPQPSWLFTHGRKGTCMTASFMNFVILNLMGHKVITISGETPLGNHGWNEAYIDGEVYIVNICVIVPREGTYEKWGWTITSCMHASLDYDPDWYKK